MDEVPGVFVTPYWEHGGSVVVKASVKVRSHLVCFPRDPLLGLGGSGKKRRNGRERIERVNPS